LIEKCSLIQHTLISVSLAETFFTLVNPNPGMVLAAKNMKTLDPPSLITSHLTLALDNTFEDPTGGGGGGGGGKENDLQLQIDKLSTYYFPCRQHLQLT
jgi:hypothetical protein